MSLSIYEIPHAPLLLNNYFSKLSLKFCWDYAVEIQRILVFHAFSLQPLYPVVIALLAELYILLYFYFSVIPTEKKNNLCPSNVSERAN